MPDQEPFVENVRKIPWAPLNTGLRDDLLTGSDGQRGLESTDAEAPSPTDLDTMESLLSPTERMKALHPSNQLSDAQKAKRFAMSSAVNHAESCMKELEDAADWSGVFEKRDFTQVKNEVAAIVAALKFELNAEIQRRH